MTEFDRADGQPGREEYVRYLDENGLSESDVLPMLPPSEDTAKVQAILLSALKAGSNSEVERYCEATVGNTNLLLATMHDWLRIRLAAYDLTVPENTFAGVFPTNSFNAHVVKRPAWYLILVNTGAFELIETMTALLVSAEPNAARARAKIAAGFLRAYCDDRTLPQPSETKKLNLTRERQEAAMNFTTIIEEFVLLHEYGHLANGDVGHAVAEIRSAVGHSIPVAAKTKNQEFEADLWAAHALTSIGWGAASEGERLLKCSGALMFLSLAGLIEAYFEHKGERFDTHPPADDRYIEIMNAFAKAGLHSHTRMGTTFNRFCWLIAEELGVEIRKREGELLVIQHVGSLVAEGLQDPVPILAQSSRVFADVPKDMPVKEERRSWKFRSQEAR